MFRRRVKRAAESIKRIPPGRQYYIGPARRASCVYTEYDLSPLHYYYWLLHIVARPHNDIVYLRPLGELYYFRETTSYQWNYIIHHTR